MYNKKLPNTYSKLHRQVFSVKLNLQQASKRNKDQWSLSVALAQINQWFDMSIGELTWATVATKLAILPPILGFL
jgi:hypothetical protein